MGVHIGKSFRSATALCKVLTVLVVLALCQVATQTYAQKKIEVDMALVLAVDVSSSVDAGEFDLQTQGLAQAFVNPDVIAAIERCSLRKIAVMVVQWSGLDRQVVAVPWTIVGDSVSASALAAAISLTPRYGSGQTSISAALDFSAFQLYNMPFKARRLVIDISGDGVNNHGDLPQDARKRAIAAGITINGLSILNEVLTLDFYFKTHVVGGSGSFVMVANDYEAYGAAILRKLLKETRCVPIS